MRYICEVKGCDRPTMNGGRSKMCDAHYQRKRRGVTNWDAVIPTKCENCNVPINTDPRRRGGRFSTLCHDCRTERDKTYDRIKTLKRTLRRRHTGDNHAPGETS